MTLSVADPRAAFLDARAELLVAFETVLDSGTYILGDRVTDFEHRWADFCDCRYAIGASSGTDALALALRASGVGKGDEVLVPAMTAVATWMAVAQIGAIPVGVDIEPIRNGMDPELARVALTERTRALVAVHLFGQVADVAALGSFAADAGITLIEDAAQAHGARSDGQVVGSFGRLAAFSFYPTKNLPAMGDAGAVTTSEPELADRVKALREYGWRSRADAELEGINARLDELQAAVLLVMLPRLRAAAQRRRAIAQTYLEGLRGASGLELPMQVPGSEPTWHLFVVRHDHRDELAAGLARAGIGSSVHYAPAPPFNSAFRGHGRVVGSFPIAERHARTALTLPMYPSLSDTDVRRVIDAVQAACRDM